MSSERYAAMCGLSASEGLYRSTGGTDPGASGPGEEDETQDRGADCVRSMHRGFRGHAFTTGERTSGRAMGISESESENEHTGSAGADPGMGISADGSPYGITVYTHFQSCGVAYDCILSSLCIHAGED